MPGIGLLMEGAMQQAPQRGLHVAGGAGRVVEGVGGAAGIGGLSVQVARRRQPA
jgi:hypothetical protein